MPVEKPESLKSFGESLACPGCTVLYAVDQHGYVVKVGEVPVDSFDPNALAAFIQLILTAATQTLALIQMIISGLNPPKPTPGPAPTPTPGPFFPTNIGTGTSR